MKTKQKLMIAIAFGIILASCSTGSKTGEEANSQEATTEDAAPKYSMRTAVGVIHDVEDFDAWLPAFLKDSDPEARISVLRNTENTNTLFVILWSESHDAAREMSTNEDLKNAMKEAGVISDPIFNYYDLVWVSEESVESSYRLTISHEVADFVAWKEKFDADEQARTEAGLTLTGMATDADNPNLVYIMFAADNTEAGEAMMSSPDLKQKMEEAGVMGEPQSSWWAVADYDDDDDNDDTDDDDANDDND